MTVGSRNWQCPSMICKARLIGFLAALSLMSCSKEVSQPVDTTISDGQESTNSSLNPPVLNTADELGAMAARQLDDCKGWWVNITNDAEGNASGMSLKVSTETYEIQFSDFGTSSGSWSASGTLDVALTLQDSERDDKFLLSECTATGALMEFSDGRELRLERATGNLFSEGQKRGIDFSENDAAAE